MAVKIDGLFGCADERFPRLLPLFADDKSDLRDRFRMFLAVHAPGDRHFSDSKALISVRVPAIRCILSLPFGCTTVRCSACILVILFILTERYLHGKAGPFTEHALDVDRTADRAEDVPDDGQAEAGTMTGALRRIERLEDLLLYILTDATAGVTDAENQMSMPAHQLDPELLPLRLFHRLKGILAEVHEDMLRHALSSEDIERLLCDVCMHGDHRRCQLLDDTDCMPDLLRKVQLLQTYAGILPCEGQQLLREVRGPIDRYQHLMDHLLILRRDIRIVLEQLRVDHDGRQIVIELMRDVARHHAERLDTLIVPDLLVLSGHRLHAPVDFLQVRDLLFLGYCLKMALQHEHHDDPEQHDIDEHDADHRHHHIVERRRKLRHRQRRVHDPALSLDIDRLKGHHTLYPRMRLIRPVIGIDHTGSGILGLLLLQPRMHAAVIELRIQTLTSIERIEADLRFRMMHDDVQVLILHHRITVFSDFDLCHAVLVQCLHIHREAQLIGALLRIDFLLDIQLIPACNR